MNEKGSVVRKKEKETFAENGNNLTYEEKEDRSASPVRNKSPPTKRRKFVHKPFPPFIPNITTSLKTEQLVRLMIQTMNELGLSSSASALEQETNIHEENDTVKKFRLSILQGEWEEAEILLNELYIESDQLEFIKWLIFKERFLESLEKLDLPQAIELLRVHITPISMDLSSKIDDLDFLNGYDFISALRNLSS